MDWPDHWRAWCIWRSWCGFRLSKKDHFQRWHKSNDMKITWLWWYACNAVLVRDCTKEKNSSSFLISHPMKKERLISLKISQSWKRTAVFLKLVRHKLDNGHLSWTWDQYSFALIGHYRKTEWSLLEEIHKEETRWWDRHSQEYKSHILNNPMREKKKIFNKYEFDNELRKIITDIDSREKEQNLSKSN